MYQQLLDFAHNTIEGFDSSDSQSLLLVLSRQLGELRTRADDVANWPNVSSLVLPPAVVGGFRLTPILYHDS